MGGLSQSFWYCNTGPVERGNRPRAGNRQPGEPKRKRELFLSKISGGEKRGRG